MAGEINTEGTELVERESFPWPLLSIDVETNPANNNFIFSIGAVRSQDDLGLTLNTRKLSTNRVGEALNSFQDRSRYLVGHNARNHDVPVLAEQYGKLALHDLPILDTLELSAIAFPTNPYHRLVKGYKLLSDSRNDPEKDAKVTLDLLREELDALSEMHEADPQWVTILHYLIRSDKALNDLCIHVRGVSEPSFVEARAFAHQRFKKLCCFTSLRRVIGQNFGSEHQERLAVAYALGWIRVSGGNSVLPLWVSESIPGVRKLVGELREIDCGSPECDYCRENHNPEKLLSQFFQKPSFRLTPTDANGSSLQRAIVVAGLQRKSLLAVLPTGGGKSICYQLPALVHYWRSGQLTVIISPLQSLMKDQVDNLLAAGVTCAVTINGLLTPLERRAALDKVRLGDAGIVLVSPEQFRSKTFTEAIKYREIATWVFDEAHCLSKWGHDFRTDYLYVSRFIKENLSARMAPVACFTATAKPDVIEDLSNHFKDSLGMELEQFLGGHERTNLNYTVVPAKKQVKAQRIAEIIEYELKNGGAAVVFCATRKSAEIYTEVLVKAGVRCEYFHGGMTPERKKEVQGRFIAGEVPVIAATNAFGMGVDKPDVRVVIHADIPGSLENYLQEAGRAGRDGDPAHCVLLFDEDDVEMQFRLSGSSKLSHKDFVALLKGVRERSRKLKSNEIVVSTGELLRESQGTSIEQDSPDASTKVTTAVAWLERGGFLRRDENNTKVFPASLRVASLDAAVERISRANLPQTTKAKFEAVVASLFRSQTPEGISTDELMLDAGIPAEECFRILFQLDKLGILSNDLGLTVRLTKGVKGASDIALEFLVRLERELLSLLSEQAPDADMAGEEQYLSVRSVCSELRQRLDLKADDRQLTPERLRNCLRSLSESFGSGTEKRSMMHVRGMGPDALKIALHRSWENIRTICERRRAVAQVALLRLLKEVPEGVRESGLVIECKAQALLDALEEDLELKGMLKEPSIALEHALLYMHENKVLDLDKGRSVFRAAMTIRIDPEGSKRRYLKEDFAPLLEFYRERTLQTHVMHEYAKLGLTDPSKAAQLVNAYFTLAKKTFVRDFFKGRPDLHELATTEESFRRIVDDLKHPVQQALVESPEVGNHLILAGPGSGKTRVIVHRIAYLVRVRRIPPESIIALAFNRFAAIELKRRLEALIGSDAWAITVMTYHAMALRLTGTSLSVSGDKATEIDFSKLLADAVSLLEGGSGGLGDADDLRDRLLQGYEYIFVDEYQDIDEQQYALVSALAGRKRGEADAKLSIMAVGDDDQNIYSFKGADVEFIRRFQEDYGADVTYLVENFRSSQNIIAAANHVIQRGRDRMKINHPIRINDARVSDHAGGHWASIDVAGQGVVKVMNTPSDVNIEAQLVLKEVRNIQALDMDVTPGDIAIIARTHRALDPVRAACELYGIRCQMLTPEANAARVSLMKSREGWQVAKLLRKRSAKLVSMLALKRLYQKQMRQEPENPYLIDIKACIDELGYEASAERLIGSEILEALYEAAGEARKSGQRDALRLMTAHGAKGLEFAHVIVMDCGDWRSASDDERRLLYVAMTRAKENLVLMRGQQEGNPFLQDLESVIGVKSVFPSKELTRLPEINKRYQSLGPSDVDIGYQGRHPEQDPIHERISALRVGDRLLLERRMLKTQSFHIVGRLAAKTVLDNSIHDGVVTGFMVRTKASVSAQYVQDCTSDLWEVPLVEVSWIP